MIADMRKQLLTFMFVMLGWALLPSAVGAVSSNLVISEVQTQSATSTTQELIELYNASSSPVDVTGWKVEYVSATGSTVSAAATLNGSVPGHSFVLLSRAGYLPTADYYFSVGLAEAGGHVRLVDAGKQVIDAIGWGTATQPETATMSVAAKGESLRRESDAANLFKDTDNNAVDFMPDLPDPQMGLREMPPEENPTPEPEPSPEPAPEPEIPPIEEPPGEPESLPIPEQPPLPEAPPVEPNDPPPAPQPPRPCHRHSQHHHAHHHFVKKYLKKLAKHKQWRFQLLK
jgi:uncharacterized protein